MLIPASHFGGIAFGSDLDFRVLKGYKVGYTKESLKSKQIEGKRPNIFTNFREYHLPLPNIMRADINNSFFYREGIFDAIICDPPYGYRAFSRENTGKTAYKNPEMLDEYNNGLIKGEEKLDKMTFENDYSEDGFNPYQGGVLCFAPLKLCSIDQIFQNLLNFASRVLRTDGLLVCLYPVDGNKDLAK